MFVHLEIYPVDMVEGQMDMISIQHNNLEYINEYTFTKIKGLQSLDLSENSLVNIPMGTFSGLTDFLTLPNPQRFLLSK
jgi:hypothetical protein